MTKFRFGVLNWLRTYLPGLGRSRRGLPTFGPRSGEIRFEGNQAIIAAARQLPHGAPVGNDLRDLLTDEIRRRRIATGTNLGPEDPRVGDLIVMRDGLPDWWASGENLILVSPSAHSVEIDKGIYPNSPTRNSIVVLGSRVLIQRLSVINEGSLCVIGDDVHMPGSLLIADSGGTMLIGAKTSATQEPMVGVKNGGIIVVGEDGMWGPFVYCFSDDAHAIRDRRSGVRHNLFGGRVVIDDHVWLGLGTHVTGDSYVGHNSVVGAGSFVKNTALPPHSVSAGRPARTVRQDIIWTRDDLP